MGTQMNDFSILSHGAEMLFTIAAYMHYAPDTDSHESCTFSQILGIELNIWNNQPMTRIEP